MRVILSYTCLSIHFFSVSLRKRTNKVNTNNYDYIYKAVDRRRGPEDEPIRRESRRVGGKRPGDHPVIQEEAAGEETRR